MANNHLLIYPLFTPRQKKRQLISDHLKGPLVAAFRSPLMKALYWGVETLGLWIVTFSVTFIKSVNQSSIKPCLVVHLAAVNINYPLVWGYWQDNDRLITGLGEVCSKNIMIFISTIRNFITEFSIQRVVRFQRINCVCENCLTTKIRSKNNLQETDRTQTISWKKLAKKISGHRWKFCFLLI